MTDVTSLFDRYSLQARLYPAFLTAAPIAITVALIWTSSPLARLWPLVLSLGGMFFLATWVRGRGQAVEKTLVSDWNGMPTTHLLRHSEVDNESMFDRRRRLLTAAVQIALPDQSTELADPKRADAIYITATRALIARVRGQRRSFPRVQEENTHYGFRRNLYALKPIAIAILIANLVFDVLWILRVNHGAAAIVTLIVHVGLLLVWFSVVKSDWVRQQGETYAERLFESLEDPRLLSGG